MTAPTQTVEAVEPVELLEETDAGEWRVRFPVLVLEGMDTSDGRFIEAGALTHRALPLSLLAQTESAHGGDEPGPAVIVGRIDALERIPGSDVISRRTGEPFPDGTFVWAATGAIDPSIDIDGRNLGNLVRRRYLRGVSVDLVGMDYDILGMPMAEDDPGLPRDPDNPARQLVTHAAEIAAATLVPIPAFGDAYMELEDETTAPDPITAEELPDGLLASAVPAWRSSEVGDECGLCLAGLVAAAAGGTYVEQTRDRLGAALGNDEIENWGENAERLLDLYTLLALTRGGEVTSQEVHDAWAVATARTDPDHRSLVPFDELAPDVQVLDDQYRDAIVTAATATAPADEADDDAITAAGDEGPHTGGMIALVPADPDQLTVAGGDPAEDLHLTLAYLGEDVTGWDDEQRAAVLDAVRQLAEVTPPVEAEVMGHAAFNPTGANDREPCAVYLVSGDMLPALKGEAAAFDVSEHPVFLPHVTAGYGLTPDALSYVGPVVFDRLRVALADEVTDYPLGEPRAEDPDNDEPGEELVAAAAAPAEEVVVEPVDGIGIPDAPQPCEFGEHPAVRSLLFGDGEAYVPVCDEHEEQARERIAAAGDEVTEVVDIAQPDDEDGDDGEAVVVAAGAVRPPAGWFVDPQLEGPTPLTIDEDGRIRGHAAVFGTCHIGFPQQCVTAPRSRSGYAYFATGAVLTDEGEEVPVGSITMDTGHAPTSMSRQAAAAHYDHTGAVVADVAVGEDQFGIWVAGALRADIDEVTAARLRASALSGDWRRVGGGLELVALLAVNVPGFPVPRARVAAGEPQALVAAGALPAGAPIESVAVGQLSTGTLGSHTEITVNGDPEKIRRRFAEVLRFDSSSRAGHEQVEHLADAIAARLEQRQQAGQLSAQHAALVAELDDSPDRAAALLAELDDSPQRAAELLAALDDEVDEAEVEEYISRMPAQLRESYLRGEVAARIAWGTPGDFTRCVAQATKHGVPARMRDGMCAQLHRDAVGFWPGDRRNR
jgi:hypothetical protein